MRSLASDNNSGVHPLIMEAIVNANQDHAVGYGADPWTKEAVQKIKDTFATDCEVLFTFNGTGCNCIALQLATRPYHAIYCADTAHIFVDECGAPAKATGCQLIAIPTPDGKLTADLLRPHLHGFGDQHHSQPGAIYISQCTEFGTIYTPGEIVSITTLAHQHHMYVHMDGARLSNAAAALNTSLKALTVDCDIDLLTFGGTKNGLMMGEALVVFRPELMDAARFIRKQTAQLASKMRYVSCQFTALLKEDLWRKNATHSNRMAQRLHEGMKDISGITFTKQVESNELFFTAPRSLTEQLLQDYFFYIFNEEKNEARLVTSFDTTEEDVEGFLQTLRRLA